MLGGVCLNSDTMEPLYDTRDTRMSDNNTRDADHETIPLIEVYLRYCSIKADFYTGPSKTFPERMGTTSLLPSI